MKHPKPKPRPEPAKPAVRPCSSYYFVEPENKFADTSEHLPDLVRELTLNWSPK